MLVNSQTRPVADSRRTVPAVGSIDNGFGAQYSALTGETDPALAVPSTADHRLALMAPLLPTEENVSQMLKEVQGQLREKMASAGISESPSFEFNEDPATGRISISGDRPDKAKIEAMINDDQQLRLNLHNVRAMASNLPLMKAAAQYAQAWANATSDSQRTAVYNYYRSLFESLHSETTLSMGAGGLALTLNGDAIPTAA
jgi:hypothetical protein